MILTLPSDPPPARMAIGVVRASNDLSPDFAGADQELRRKGSRFALTFTMPSMSYVDHLAWTDLMSEGDTVVMEVQQPGLDIGSPGTPLVQGGAQAGASLTLDGLSAYYAIRKGQFFSVITVNQRFLYRAASAVTANGSGVVTVPLTTMLRRPPNDNDPVEIAVPKIEGFVRDLKDVEVDLDHQVGLTFTIRERE